MLSELPATQQIELFTKWLSYFDIACLDSATCSTSHRTELHKVLSMSECYFEEQMTIYSSAAATWIMKRNLNLRDVELTYGFLMSNSDRTALLGCIGKSIKTLELSWGWDDPYEEETLPYDEICFDICRKCPNLEAIKIQDATLDGVLSLFIANSKNLRELSLRSCTNITNCILAACCSSTSLRALHINDCKINIITIIIIITMNPCNKRER